MVMRLFKFRIEVTTQIFFKNKFYCNSNIELFRTLKYGDEESALGAFLFLLKEDDTVWDIGASVGLFSIYSSDVASKVISFEPEPKIFSRLLENIDLNNKSDKIKALNIGLSDNSGKVDINSDGIDGFSPSIVSLDRHSSKASIEIRTIDELIAQNKITHPTVLKIDIEGAELKAIIGGSTFLSSANKPRLIFLEVHPEFLKSDQKTATDVIKQLEAFGYTILSTQTRDDQFHLIAVG